MTAEGLQSNRKRIICIIIERQIFLDENIKAKIISYVIITSNIKNNTARLIIGIIVAFIVGYGAIGLISLDYKTDERNYNNGICSICNEKLDLFDIEYHRGAGDEYYYKCKNNHLVRTSHHFD